jgi:hypothetical protein
LEERTGVRVKRIEIQEINFMRDVAKIKIFHDINELNGKKLTKN